jgi:uncharacterized membrane protein YtjA (UPF0391 family)
VRRARTKRPPWVSYALGYLGIPLVAGILGFGVISGSAATIAQVLFLVFLALGAASPQRRDVLVQDSLQTPRRAAQ